MKSTSSREGKHFAWRPKLARAISTSALALALVGHASLAYAQEQSESRQDEAGEGGLETIVVTATRRNESLQKVPISATTFGEEQLIDIGASGINDIALRSPNVRFGDFGDLKLNIISMRGVVSGINGNGAGTDPSVGTYVDDVFLGNGVGATIDLYDVQQIEVLRGPQGTLFGRNTIGGAISITTRRPQFDLGGFAEVEVGNFDRFRTRGSVTGPITDNLAIRLSGVVSKRDGLFDNLVTGEDVGTEDLWSVNGQILFKPSDNQQWLLTYEHREVDQSPNPFETLRYRQTPSQIAPGTFVPPIIDILNGALDPLVPPQLVNDDPFDRQITSNVIASERLNAESIALRGEISFETFDMVTVTSYREHEYASRNDTDGTGLRWLVDGDPEDVQRYSQELRFASNDGGDFDWLFGLYFYGQDSINEVFLNVEEDLALLLLGAPTVVEQGVRSDTNIRSYSGFASFNWRPAEAWELTLGGRYTYEKRSIVFEQNDPLGFLGGSTPAPIKLSNDFSAFTPSVSVKYFASEDVMFYGTVSRGFKAGGFNESLGAATEAALSFDPETLWNYELGAKLQILDNRLRINAAYFYMDWSDIQVRQDNPDTLTYDPFTSNAGKAYSTGIELEIQAKPTDNLLLSAGFGLLKAKFNEGLVALAPDPFTALPREQVPLTDMPFAPEYSLSLAADWTIPLGNVGTLDFRPEYILQGPQALVYDIQPGTPSGNDVGGIQKEVGLLNMRLTYRPPSERFSITVWAQNLTDETYSTRLISQIDNALLDTNRIALNTPRTFGATFRVNF
jgi:iron complex outermembrane recepter protein